MNQLTKKIISEFSPMWTNKQVWEFEAGGGFTGSPAVSQERLVIASNDGKVYCFGKK